MVAVQRRVGACEAHEGREGGFRAISAAGAASPTNTTAAVVVATAAGGIQCDCYTSALCVEVVVD